MYPCNIFNFVSAKNVVVCEHINSIAAQKQIARNRAKFRATVKLIVSRYCRTQSLKGILGKKCS